MAASRWKPTTLTVALLACATQFTTTENAMGAMNDARTIDTTARVEVDAAAPQWTISKYLTGSHFVYAFERDSLYEDERIANWMRRSKVAAIRWPGGTAVQTYHWDDLNGIPFKQDSWNPQLTLTKQPPSDYMDLDEYIAYCRRVGAEPMVGVNNKSGKLFKRMKDALDEAQRLIQYCVDKNYNVKHWYIGNECYIGFTATGYTQSIDIFARVLKSVDPDIEIIADWKFGPEEKGRFKETVAIAKNSRHIDVMELHEKWGNQWGLASGQTLEDWQNEFPLYNGRLAEYMKKFREEMKATGRNHVKMGFNEWGVGGIKGGDRFDAAMVAADFMIEMFRNDVYQACYWNLNMGKGVTQILHTEDDHHRLIELNPIADVFVMFGHALEKELLLVDSSNKRVYGFATIDKENSAVMVYLLNKSPETSRVAIEVSGAQLRSGARVESFARPGKVEATNVDDTGAIALKPYSFNRIVLGR